jgi:hypothetical protein
MLLWAVGLKRPYLSSMQSLPLENDPESGGVPPASSLSQSSSSSNAGEGSRTRTRTTENTTPIP